jgi:DNA-binding MarR family transcriptional regulator
MALKTREAVSRRRISCLEEDVFIALHRTADVLARSVERVLRAADVSPTQYNVLRILRGSPQGLPCREIGDRMVTRDPDITRLLDRLEKRSLISRCRETKDRRMVLTRITPQGLRLLADLDGPVTDAHRHQLSHLGREGLGSLMNLLESARQKVEQKQIE